MGSIINLDGRILPPEQALVPAMDHGFLFGDSIYETLRTFRRVPFLMDRHLDRSEYCAAGLGLEIPWSRDRLRQEVLRSLDAADNEESMVRIVVTRGPGKLDMDPTEAGPPGILIYVVPHPVYPEEYFTRGAPVVLVDTRRSPSVDPTIKTGNRLANVLALAEAKRRRAFEAVMSNDAGHVTEGTSSNLFLVKEGALVTAEVEAGLLPGITRGVVLEIVERLGIPIRERAIRPEELRGADEAFLTSTTKKVMPVSRVDDAEIQGPGPVTRRLMTAFDERVEQEIRAWRP